MVGTPIGNLGDLTPRAARALREADAVVAEDTRMAARLLGHLKARTPSTSSVSREAAKDTTSSVMPSRLRIVSRMRARNRATASLLRR